MKSLIRACPPKEGRVQDILVDWRAPSLRGPLPSIRARLGQNGGACGASIISVPSSSNRRGEAHIPAIAVPWNLTSSNGKSGRSCSLG